VLLGETRTVIGYREQALAIAREVGDRCREGWALSGLGNAYMLLGETRTAIGYLGQALVSIRIVGNSLAEAITRGKLGNIYLDLGELDRAIKYQEHYLAIARNLGTLRFEGWALNNLAAIQVQRGNGTGALKFGTISLHLAQRVGDRELEGHCQIALGAAYALLHQPVEAGRAYLQSLNILDNIGYQSGAAQTRWAYGQFLIHQGKRERGLALMQECVDYEQRIGHTHANEHAALIAHLQAGGLPPFPTPLAAFAPLRHAIVAVAQGNEHLRAEAEAALVQWKRRFYHLTAPVKAIWAGQRDPDALTEGLSVIDAALVRQVLSDLGVDCWGELLALGAIGATAAA
jgi:tetratricopeptide (TPR) repeat protein